MAELAKNLERKTGAQFVPRPKLTPVNSLSSYWGNGKDRNNSNIDIHSVVSAVTVIKNSVKNKNFFFSKLIPSMKLT